MIVAFDVHYRETEAKIVGVFFENWTDEAPAYVREAFKTDILAYESGAFYKRELPCLLEMLAEIDLKTIDYIVVDGYVYLDDNQRSGLGWYLFEALNRQIPIVGVAKTSFHDNTKFVKKVFRGTSEKPLYVSAIGVELDSAADFIQQMAGEFRFPKLLKLLDSLTKN